MNRIRTAILIVLGLLLISACSATVRGGGRAVVTWPTADPLPGDVPVGRWACIDGNPPFDRVASSNRSSAPDVCKVLSNVLHSYVVEIRPDGSGYTLTRYWRPQS